MKTAITLTLAFATALSVSAVETEPPDQLVHRLAHNARVPGNKPSQLPCIDYKQLNKSNAYWSTGRVFALFKSIDPNKIKFESHKQFDTVIKMIEPVQAIFTFDTRRNMEDKGPPIWYYLIKVEMVGPNNPAHQKGKPEEGR